MKKRIIILSVLVVCAALFRCLLFTNVGAKPTESTLVTGTDVMLYELDRHNSLTINANIDAGFDTTLAVDNGERIGVYYINADSDDLPDSAIVSHAYILRGIGGLTSKDIYLTLFGNGVNCRWPDADSLKMTLRAGIPFYWEFSHTSIDSVVATGAADDTNLDLQFRAGYAWSVLDTLSTE